MGDQTEEMWGDMGRCGEMWGGVGRCEMGPEEMWVDGRYAREIWGDHPPVFDAERDHQEPMSKPRAARAEERGGEDVRTR